MRNRTRLLTTTAAAAMLLTTLVGASTAPADAATPTCTEATRWYNYDGNRMFLPVHYATNSINCVMRRGNNNNGAVKYLQEVLRDHFGYNIAVDGDFGPGTERALISLQNRLGIPADGVYGPKTRDRICWPLLNMDACDWRIEW